MLVFYIVFLYFILFYIYFLYLYFILFYIFFLYLYFVLLFYIVQIIRYRCVYTALCVYMYDSLVRTKRETVEELKSV